MWPFSSPTPTLNSPDSSVTTTSASHANPSNASTSSTSPLSLPLEDHATDRIVDPNLYKDVTLSTVHVTGYSNERLSMTPLIRAPILMAVAFATGLTLGSAKGGQRAADRYRAENAHRFPTTQAGWYLYQRTKSYHTVVGGVKEGVRFGGVLGLWAAGFMVTEEGVDQMRGRLLGRREDDGEEVGRKGQRDFVSTVVAAMAVAGVYSRVKRLDTFATVKTSKMALKGGVAFGLCQDVIACARGEPPGYVSWVWGKGRGTKVMEAGL